MENQVRCNNCMCVYKEEELVLLCETNKTTQYLEYYNACPTCMTDSYLMDLEDEK